MANTTLKPSQITTAKRQLRLLTVLLTLQFILGVILTTLIDYKPGKHSSVQLTYLVLHIVVAIALLGTAIVRLAYSVKWRSQSVFSWVTLISIVGAMIAGTIAAKNGNDVAVFVMAMFFLSAFGAIGYNMSSFHD